MKRIFFTLLFSLLTLVSLQAQTPHPQHHNAPGGAPDNAMHHAPQHPMPGPGHAHNPMLRVASPDQVDEIVRHLNEEKFDDRRMEIAKLCVYICPVSVWGLARMAETFSFDDRRLDFLLYAYDYCPDRENYYQLRSSLTFGTNADKLCSTLRLYDPTTRRQW